MWATWCPPCRDSIPHLSELQHKYKDVVFVGMTGERDSKPDAFVQKMGSQMDYRVCVDTSGRVTSNYMQAGGAQGIPTAFVINKAGRVVWTGHPMEAAFEEAVARVANEPGAAQPIEVPRSVEALSQLKISALRKILDDHNILAVDCLEKSDLVQRIMEKIVNK
jgi:hypothetical protein